MRKTWDVKLDGLRVLADVTELDARIYAVALIHQATAQAYKGPSAWTIKAKTAAEQIEAGTINHTKVGPWLVTVHRRTVHEQSDWTLRS